MDEARKMMMPEIELAENDPLFAGVLIAAEVFSRMLLEKIDEYGAISEQAGKVLNAFELYYVTYFGRDLKFSLLTDKEWEEKLKDPVFKEKVEKLEDKHGMRR